MSALPIIETQKSETVGLLTTNKERELGSDRPETGYFYPADAIVIASICEATMSGTHSSDDAADYDDADADDADVDRLVVIIIVCIMLLRYRHCISSRRRNKNAVITRQQGT